MSTAPGRILGNPSVKALRKWLSGRVAHHPDKTRATSAGSLMPVTSALPQLTGFISTSPSGVTASDAAVFVFRAAAQAASDTAVNGQNGCHETLAHRHLNRGF
jgi:hypothetical protein